jgi:hypothetical protein
MRIPAITCVVLCLAVGTAAADDVYEPHALLYVQASFSGNAQDRKASFGLRLDQTYHARDATPDFRQLLARPALAEFRMDSDGVREFSFAGSNYDRAYRVHRANGEGGAAEQTEAAPPENEAETMEPGAEESTAAVPEAEPEPAVEEEEGRSLGEYLEEIPAGYLIGIGLGVVLLTGLGD